MKFSFLIPILVLFHIQSVDSCIRFFDDCCLDYIPHQLPENTRFNDPDIFYMTPKITKNSDCSKVTVDCTFSGMPSDIYNLVFTDSSDKVTKVMESKTPAFELDCNTGIESYVSCELGCTSEKCSLEEGCQKCNTTGFLLPLRENYADVIQFFYNTSTVDGCIETEVECAVLKRVDFCTFSLLGLAEKYGTIDIGEPIKGKSIKTKLHCAGDGKYEYDGYKLKLIKCDVTACLIGARMKREAPEMCSSCADVTSTLFKPRSGENEILPSSYSTKIVDGCVESSIKCNLENSSFCRFKMFGVGENADSNSLHLIGEAIDAEQLIENIKCGENGKYEHNGHTIDSIYCTYEECQKKWKSFLFV